jgi:5-methylcytosine-specific restriction protein A
MSAKTSKKTKYHVSRKAFIESLGATCKNWQWSWSFVNNDKRFVIFGEWQDRSDRKPGLILSPDWEIRNGRINRGFRQALEHMRLVEEEGYRLFTLPMLADESKEKTGGRVSIKDFTKKITEKTAQKKADGWYAVALTISSGNNQTDSAGKMDDAKNWKDDELKSSVSAYIEMLKMQKTGQSFNKKEIYRILATETGRSPKSIEYRMQNISFVLQLSGRNTVAGLAPARNVGSRVIDKIEQILSEMENRAPDPQVRFNAEVIKLRSRENRGMPAGQKNPTKKDASSTTYVRSPEVVAWILNNANGRCEACMEKGPFLTSGNEPFLEVHHVHFLSEGGPDTPQNAIAVCPNCHRAFHHSKDKEKMVVEIYKNIERLIKTDKSLSDLASSQEKMVLRK